MKPDFDEIVEFAKGRSLTVERIRVGDSKLAIEGEFELPPLAALSNKDQIFVAAFISCHGSIKEMERLLGVSYPTIKNRLRKLTEAMNLVEVASELPSPDEKTNDVLTRLENGELDAAQALRELES